MPDPAPAPLVVPPSGGPRGSASLPGWLAPALLVAAIALAYANSLNAPFLFDDQGAVVDNPTIRRLASLDVLRPPTDGSTTTGRPLVNLSFALERAIGGEDVRIYHATNLALHALAALTLFGLVRRIAERWSAVTPTRFPDLSSPNQRAEVNALYLAFFAALLWAIHPLQTESVVCIAQRTELLCGLCYLATLYTFVRGSARLQPAPQDHRARAEASRYLNPSPQPSRAWLAASVLVCLAGMASKEVMVTAPLVVLLLDRTFVAGSFAAAWRARRGYYLALAATWLLLAGLVLSRGGARGEAAGFGHGVTPWHYLLTQGEALTLYLRLAVWPHPLVLDYGTGVVSSLAAVWWQGPVVLALLVGSIWALVRRPALGFLGATFFLILAPSSSFVPLVTQTIAEHRMYLPLAALVTGFTFAAWGNFRRGAFGLLGSLAVIFGATTGLRTHDYRDGVAIWSDTAHKRPENPRAHNNLALALQQQGNADLAQRHFARAVELRPDYAAARYNWGVALLDRGRLAEANTQLGEAVRLSPALRIDPKFAEAQFELGRLAERDGRPVDAEAKYREAIALAPHHAGARAKLGLLLARSERLEPAAEQFRALIRLQPGDADAHANLGNVLLLLGQPQAALASYEAALRLRPDDLRTRENIRLAREAAR